MRSEYEKFAQGYINDYLISANGNSFFARIIKKLFKINIIRILYSKNKLLDLQNALQCEAHRELFLAGLKGIN